MSIWICHRVAYFKYSLYIYLILAACCVSLFRNTTSVLWFYQRNCLCPWHRDPSPDTHKLSAGKCRALRGDKFTDIFNLITNENNVIRQDSC